LIIVYLKVLLDLHKESAAEERLPERRLGQSAVDFFSLELKKWRICN
jgi:hypothetical protein